MDIPAGQKEEDTILAANLPVEMQWLSSLIVSKHLTGEWDYDIASEAAQVPDDPVRVQRHCEQKTLTSLSQFFKGVQSYNTHPYQREETKALPVWKEGSTRLLDYGSGIVDTPDVPLVLFIPSLINRSYILDLNEKRSLLRYLSGQKIYAYLIDWGEPVADELAFSFSDYIGRIERMIAKLFHDHGRKVVLAGYCMGGLMALPSALQNLEKVKAVALLATPWDFHQTRLSYSSLDRVTIQHISDIVSKMERIPKHLIQGFFYSQNPQMVHDKFVAFSQLDPASQEAAEFVAVERWVGDGISIPSPIAKECLIDWGYHNITMQGKWQCAGQVMDMSSFPLPVFIAIAEHDHIVPPSSALPLAALIPDVSLRHIPAGHVGMIIGRSARQHLWSDLTNWLHCTIK